MTERNSYDNGIKWFANIKQNLFNIGKNIQHSVKHKTFPKMKAL